MDYFERKLDDKHRLTIPAELRAEFESGDVVITQGFGKYLHIYTLRTWNEQMEPALKGSILDEQVADLNVRIRMGRMVVPMDGKQGRITLDPALIKYAGIKREVVAIRAGAYWRLVAKEKASI
jgi:division/cell wall cluster transcriptional repressor MraZ